MRPPELTVLICGLGLFPGYLQDVLSTLCYDICSLLLCHGRMAYERLSWWQIPAGMWIYIYADRKTFDRGVILLLIHLL